MKRENESLSFSNLDAPPLGRRQLWSAAAELHISPPRFRPFFSRSSPSSRLPLRAIEAFYRILPIAPEEREQQRFGCACAGRARIQQSLSPSRFFLRRLDLFLRFRAASERAKGPSICFSLELSLTLFHSLSLSPLSSSSRSHRHSRLFTTAPEEKKEWPRWRSARGGGRHRRRRRFSSSSSSSSLSLPRCSFPRLPLQQQTPLPLLRPCPRANSSSSSSREPRLSSSRSRPVAAARSRAEGSCCCSLTLLQLLLPPPLRSKSLREAAAPRRDAACSARSSPRRRSRRSPPRREVAARKREGRSCFPSSSRSSLRPEAAARKRGRDGCFAKSFPLPNLLLPRPPLPAVAARRREGGG